MPRKVPKRKPKAARRRATPERPPVDVDALLASPEFMALLGPDDRDLPDDDPEPGAIDAGLMALAITCVAAEAAESGSGSPVVAAARAYAAYHGKDDGNPVTEEETPRIVELARRLAAAADIAADLGPPAGDDPGRLLAIAEAASATPLVESGGRPSFDRAEFLAAMERARTALG